MVCATLEILRHGIIPNTVTNRLDYRLHLFGRRPANRSPAKIERRLIDNGYLIALRHAIFIQTGLAAQK
jgi:hypothetical protein